MGAAAAIVWPVLLLATVPLDQLGASDLAFGAALALANAAVGVAVHKAAVLPFRRLHARRTGAP